MRLSVLVACLAVMAAAAAAAETAAVAEVSPSAGAVPASEQGPQEPATAPRHPDEPRSRPQRWVVFRPMFATRGRQRQLNRAWKNHELRRQSRTRGQRHRRALHFPTGGVGSGEESGLALRVAVNDLLFQSAPANDLPEQRVVGLGAAGPGLRPMLLARLRGASRERADTPAAEEEAFLLMSAGGGRPAIVPAPTTRPHQAPAAGHKKQAHTKHHKVRKGDKQRRRVARDTSSSVATALGQRLDAMAGSVRERGALAERVKKYDAQGMYPAYSYNNGRYTRAAAAGPAGDGVKVMKVKVQGAVDEDDEEEEGMEAAETIVFRPLFVHRDRQAVKQEAKRRRLGFAKKSTKPVAKPLRRRPPQAAAPAAAVGTVPVKRLPAAAAYFHRRTYLKYPPRYQYSPYRRVVYYH